MASKVGAEVVEVLDVPAAYLCKCGLNNPVKRFICLATVAAGVAYLVKVPRKAFREDGSAKPSNMLAAAKDGVGVTDHFLTYPVAASLAFVALLT